MPDLKNRKLTIYDFGLADYKVIWRLQQELVQSRIHGDMTDVLLIGEHPEVITTGRGYSQEGNLLNPQVPIVEIERGGDVTWHGPGQLIAYPVIRLTEDERDLHAYLRKLEETLILTLRDFDLWGLRHKGYTGVWVLDQAHGQPAPKAQEGILPAVRNQPRKIASIGVAVKQWVTYHGIALNVNPDLARFGQINPCGLPATVMTSLKEQLERPPGMETVKTALIERFGRVFDYAAGEQSALRV